MCEPVTITMGVMAAAGAAASIAGQKQQQKAAQGFEDQKARAVDYQASETRKRATDDYINQVRLEQTQQRQEQEAVVEKSADLARQTTAAIATGKASAAERGIGGGRTLDSILADYRVQQDFEVGRLTESQKLRNQQHSENIKGFETQYNNRSTSVQPYIKKPVAPVDYFGPIFGAVGQTIGAGVSTGAFKGLMTPTPPNATPSANSLPMYSDGE